MNMSLPTGDQVQSFLRHVYTAAATATGILAVVGLSQGDATAIGNAVHQIGDGVAAIIAGVSTLVPIISGTIAAIKQSRASRLKALDRDPQIARVITVPGTQAQQEAAAIPGNKVT